MKRHVAGDKADDSIRVGGAIVEQVGDALHGGLGAMGLLGGKRADGREHGGVDGAGIKKERAEDFLDAFGVGGVERGCVVGRGGVLCWRHRLVFATRVASVVVAWAAGVRSVARRIRCTRGC